MVEKISRKINILEMHSSLGYAGGQRNMFTFVKNLNRSIFNVFVASYVEGGMYESKLKEINVEFVVSKRDIETILEFIKLKKIDVIHIHRSGGYAPIENEIFEGAKKINKDILIVEKNVFGKYDNISGKYIGCSFFQSMMHLNERYLPVAHTVYNPKKMKVMYNMVDADDFKKYTLNADQILSYKTTLGIAESDFVVGKIARPDLSKWSDLILEMMPCLSKLVPQIKVVILGAPKSRVKIIKNSKFKNNFILLQDTSDQVNVHSFYQSIDVLVHSSKIGECNGNTINEAMFWRKPVVVNSTPDKDNGQLEQVDHMLNGIVANYPQTFARAVEFLYENLEIRKSMGDNGYKKVLEHNSPDEITKKLEKVIIETLHSRGFVFDLSVKELYDNIVYSPTEKDVLGYKIEYRQRLFWDFGKLSIVEKLLNFLYKPKKFYFKVKDFLEHNYGIIV